GSRPRLDCLGPTLGAGGADGPGHGGRDHQRAAGRPGRQGAPHREALPVVRRSAVPAARRIGGTRRHDAPAAAPAGGPGPGRRRVPVRARPRRATSYLSPGGASPMSEKEATPSNLTRTAFVVVLAGQLGCLLWAYWPALLAMEAKWSQDPQYSHGYLVPVFAAGLLWLRRSYVGGPSGETAFDALGSFVRWLRRPSIGEPPGRLHGWGIPILVLGVTLYVAGGYVYFDWLAGFSLLPAVLGLCVLWCGWKALPWAGPSVAFLAFMLPLPYRLEMALAGPLRRFATAASTYVLQTAGLPAVAEGNVIVLNDARIGV